MSTDYLGKIWKEIKGKSLSPGPRPGAPSACQHKSFQTGTSQHRHVSVSLTPDACMSLLWNLSRKGGRNCRLNFCPHHADFTRKPPWKSSPPSFWWICTQRQQLNLTHENQSLDYWISKLPMGQPRPSSLLLTSSPALPLVWQLPPGLSNLSPWLVSHSLIIKFRMRLVHKGLLVAFIQQLFSEHLLCTRHAASLWVCKNSQDPVPVYHLESKR